MGDGLWFDGGMKSIKQIFEDPAYATTAGKGINKYVSREYQDYGYRLAVELGDPEHVSLYIKLAKEEDRKLLEGARTFAIDSRARKLGALFMWRLKQLKSERAKMKEKSLKT